MKQGKWKQELISHLRSLFSEKILQTLLPYWEIYHTDKAALLLHPQEEPEGYYLVLQGTLKKEAGEEIALLKRGEWLKEDLSGNRVSSLGEAAVAFIPFQALQTLLKSRPSLKSPLTKHFEGLKGESRSSGSFIRLGWPRWIPLWMALVLPLATGSLVPLMISSPWIESLWYSWFWLGLSLVLALPVALWISAHHIGLHGGSLIYQRVKLFPLKREIRKIPYQDLQTSEIRYSGFWAHLFKLGTLHIQGSASGRGINFGPVYKGEGYLKELHQLIQQNRIQGEQIKRKTMRRALEEHFQCPQWRKNPLIEEVKGPQKAKYPLLKNPIPRAFMKRRFFLWVPWRQSLSGGITRYRKHGFVLFTKILPLLGLTALWGAGAYWGGFSPFWPFVLPLIGIPLWYLWEDWRNDVYQTGPEHIMDLDRKPLGLSESRKEAPIDKIIQVDVVKKGLGSFLWDYGDLYLETAGEGTNLCFESVPSPETIQEEIFRLQKEQKLQQEVRRSLNRQKEYPLLLELYRDMVASGQLTAPIAPGENAGVPEHLRE